MNSLDKSLPQANRLVSFLTKKRIFLMSRIKSTIVDDKSPNMYRSFLSPVYDKAGLLINEESKKVRFLQMYIS